MLKRIHYEVHGEGDISIVICNGLSQSTANWRGIVRQNPQFRWILFDARGCGRSPLGKRPYHIDDHVSDLLWVLEEVAEKNPQIEEQPLFIAGFSHGGRVATRVVAKYPDRFTGLILISVGSAMTTMRNAHVGAWHNTLKLGGVRAMAWASLPNIVGRKILEKFSDWELLINGTANRNTEEGLMAMFEGMANYPAIELDARQVTRPTLVIRGDEDPLLNQKDSDDLAHWTGGKDTLFHECGHTLPLEEPIQFVETLTDFINEVLSTA